MNKARDKAKKVKQEKVRANATGTRKARKPSFATRGSALSATQPKRRRTRRAGELSQATLEQLRKLRGECLELAYQSGNVSLRLRANNLDREIRKLEDTMPVQPEASMPGRKFRIPKKVVKLKKDIERERHNLYQMERRRSKSPTYGLKRHYIKLKLELLSFAAERISETKRGSAYRASWIDYISEAQLARLSRVHRGVSWESNEGMLFGRKYDANENSGQKRKLSAPDKSVLGVTRQTSEVEPIRGQTAPATRNRPNVEIRYIPSANVGATPAHERNWEMRGENLINRSTGSSYTFGQFWLGDGTDKCYDFSTRSPDARVYFYEIDFAPLPNR